MKRFIKLFLLLCSWALVAIVSAATVMIHAPIKGTVLLTEGYHFTVDDEEGRQYL